MNLIYLFLLFFILKKDDLDDVINEYENQIQEINSIYNNENLQLVIEDDDKKKKKKNSTKFIRYQFVFFSAITGILFIVPFLSIMVNFYSNLQLYLIKIKSNKILKKKKKKKKKKKRKKRIF